MLLTQLISILAADTCDKSNGFFGLTPWWGYLPNSSFLKGDRGSCEITNFNFFGGGQASDIPLVLLAVVDDLLKIAGLVAVGFIIYGAFLYVGSQGSPDQTARAQSTILNALIGLAVAITAIVLVTFLGSQFGGS
jgi:hypothetical protein